MIKKPFTYEEFLEIYSKVTRLCVDLLIKSDEGVLLTLRAVEPRKGNWHLPGGTVLLNESLEDCVRRVAKEELGADIEPGKLLGYIEFFDETRYKGGYGHSVSLAFQCRLKSPDIKLDEQAAEYKYFNELPENMVGEHKEFLEDSGLI